MATAITEAIDIPLTFGEAALLVVLLAKAAGVVVMDPSLTEEQMSLQIADIRALQDKIREPFNRRG